MQALFAYVSTTSFGFTALLSGDLFFALLILSKCSFSVPKYLLEATMDLGTVFGQLEASISCPVADILGSSGLISFFKFL